METEKQLLMKADCNKEPHSLSGFIKNKVGKYSGAQSYHILKQQKERTEDAVLEMIMYVLHFLPLYYFLLLTILWDIDTL